VACPDRSQRDAEAAVDSTSTTADIQHVGVHNEIVCFWRPYLIWKQELERLVAVSG
jgi:hypothetical protein